MVLFDRKNRVKTPTQQIDDRFLKCFDKFEFFEIVLINDTASQRTGLLA